MGVNEQTKHQPNKQTQTSLFFFFSQFPFSLFSPVSLFFHFSLFSRFTFFFFFRVLFFSFFSTVCFSCLFFSRFFQSSFFFFFSPRQLQKKTMDEPEDNDGASAPITEQQAASLPATDDPSFNEKISQELPLRYNARALTSAADLEAAANEAAAAPFVEAPYQTFVRRFMAPNSPYRGLLVYHGTGTGKTYTAKEVAEARRRARLPKTLVVAWASILSNFREELFDTAHLAQSPVDGQWHTTAHNGDGWLDELSLRLFAGSKDELVQQVRAFMDAHYEFVDYSQLADAVSSPDAALAGRLIVVDEVHNVQHHPAYRAAIDRAVTFPDVSVLLLTATPLYDDPKEVVWLLNVLNQADGHSDRLLAVEDVFDEHDEVTEEGRAKLLQAASGHVSYVRGENPVTFPFRLYPPPDRAATLPELGFDRCPLLPTATATDVPPCFALSVPECADACGACQRCRYEIGRLQHASLDDLVRCLCCVFPSAAHTPDQLAAARAAPVPPPVCPDPDSSGNGNNNVPSQPVLANAIHPEANDNATNEKAIDPKATTDAINPKATTDAINPKATTDAIHLETTDNTTTENAIKPEAIATDNAVTPEENVRENVGANATNAPATDDTANAIRPVLPLPSGVEPTPEAEAVDVDVDAVDGPQSGGTGGTMFRGSLDGVVRQTEGGTYTYVSDAVPKMFRRDELRKYSVKMHAARTACVAGRGVVVIYSQFLDDGVVPMALALESAGYTHAARTTPLLADADKDPEDAVRAEQRKYVVFAGAQHAAQFPTEGMVARVSADANQLGQDVQVVVLTDAGAEGLDFKHVRQVHFLDPGSSMALVEQVVGRAVRHLSHKKLPFAERNVQLFLYSVAFEPHLVESADLHAWRQALAVAQRVGRVTRLLKQVAVDAVNHQAQQYFRHDLLGFSVEQHASVPVGAVVSVPVGDLPGAAACDYQDTCRYDPLDAHGHPAQPSQPPTQDSDQPQPPDQPPQPQPPDQPPQPQPQQGGGGSDHGWSGAWARAFARHVFYHEDDLIEVLKQECAECTYAGIVARLRRAHLDPVAAGPFGEPGRAAHIHRYWVFQPLDAPPTTTNNANPNTHTFALAAEPPSSFWSTQWTRVDKRSKPRTLGTALSSFLPRDELAAWNRRFDAEYAYEDAGDTPPDDDWDPPSRRVFRQTDAQDTDRAEHEFWVDRRLRVWFRRGPRGKWRPDYFDADAVLSARARELRDTIHQFAGARIDGQLHLVYLPRARTSAFADLSVAQRREAAQHVCSWANARPPPSTVSPAVHALCVEWWLRYLDDTSARARWFLDAAEVDLLARHRA